MDNSNNNTNGIPSSSSSRTKRSLANVNSPADTASAVIPKKSKGANGTMDIDQHPFVRMHHGNNGNGNGDSNGAQSSDVNEQSSPGALYLQLHRLLHAMQATEAPVDQSWQALLIRAEQAESLWQRLVGSVESTSTEETMNQSQMDALEERVQIVTRRARACVAVRRQQDTSVNHMERIFVAPLAVAAVAAVAVAKQQDVIDVDDSDDEKDATEGVTAPFSTPAVSASSASAVVAASASALAQPNVQDLQKAQREQIEEAISQMASQMKAETARIHQTLQNQTVGLDQMEDLASENVVKVQEVAQSVQQHVAANWTRTIGTWTLMFTVLGTFLVCLVTISMIPKRSGACLFFCPKPDKEFCRILPGGRKECFDVAALEQQQQQQRRDQEVLDVVDTDEPKKEPTVESAEQTCEVGMNGECLNLREQEEPIFQREEPPPKIEIPEMAKADENTRTVKAPVELKRATGGGSGGLFSEENVVDVEVDAVKEPVKPKRATGGGLFSEDNAVDDVEVDAVKEPELVKPKRKARGEGGGLFSQENVVEVGAETVPVYKGKPFSPREVRQAAASGDTARLAGYLKKKPKWANKQDKNRWGPLHLAVRSGSLGTVELLLNGECDKMLETADGRTALDIAIENFGWDHPIVDLLED